jgi:hypothetical protein
MPNTYDFPAHKRGDTFSSKIIAVLTDTDSGDPIGITSARLQVRALATGRIIHEWSTAAGTMTISGAGSNTLTMGKVEPAVTALWQPGEHSYDLEITLDDAGATTFTAPEGIFTVSADVTRD